MLYSIRWEKIVPDFPKRKRVFEPHIIHVKTTFLDQCGQVTEVTRKYEEWIGVCTNHIDNVVKTIKTFFPKSLVRYACLGNASKILPYFESRLQSGKLDSTPKPFYKVYANACMSDVGRLLNKHKISYYEKDDWLVRLYIDLCTRYDSQGFYYKWYTVSESEWLLDSFKMHPSETQSPDWTIGAFDLETVPMDGTDHVPNGLVSTDEIVMISLFKWNKRDGLQKWLLYRLPCPMDAIDMDHAHAFTSERRMLNNFHCLIQDCQVLTGYNINGFDFPCLFARLLFLGMNHVLKHYSSVKVGTNLVTTFQKKLVLDLYHYFFTFSSYDLPGFKLDEVAQAKLGEHKVPVKAKGIWPWYTHSVVTPSLVQSEQVEECFKVLRPHRLGVHEFGTFKEYMYYCLQDSNLVYRLFVKENVLSFCVERANFAALNAAHALYLGNSSFLLDLFKTYGTRLGFFLNTRFLNSPIDPNRYLPLMLKKTGKSQTYQGALNYCIAQTSFENVSIMDFASMYPSALLNCNLCYSTCTILTRQQWSSCPHAQQLLSIPYRNHTYNDFVTPCTLGEHFQYPSLDQQKDEFVIVANTNVKAFLPSVVKHFIDLRRTHQAQYKATRNVFHHNAQLCIKILINSLYGVMAAKNSCLAYMPIAMSIVTLARYQLLSSYHYCKLRGYNMCYADTDSLMVVDWPYNHCDDINQFLSLPHVELKYEERVKKIILLSCKRYIVENGDGRIKTKCFEKRVNELVKYIIYLVLKNVWIFKYNTVLSEENLPTLQDEPENVPSNSWLEPNIPLDSSGWLLWVEILQKAEYKSRDPQKYSILRKTKPLNQYKSKKHPICRMLEKYPEKANHFIEYTYSRADVSEKAASSWIMDAEDCQWVDYVQLFKNQMKTFHSLLNMAFWKRTKAPGNECRMVINSLRWNKFVQTELLFWHREKRKVTLLVEKGKKYTFCINDHYREDGVATKRKKSQIKKPNPKKKEKRVKRNFSF